MDDNSSIYLGARLQTKFWMESNKDDLVQGSGTRDDFNELASDNGLPGPVVGDLQLLNHLT